MRSLQAVFTELFFKAAVPDHGPWPVPSHNLHDARGTESLCGDEQKETGFQAILLVCWCAQAGVFYCAATQKSDKVAALLLSPQHYGVML